MSVAVALLSATLVSPAGASPSGSNPYFSAPFSVRTNPVTFGQDPSWTPDGRVLSNEPDRTGTEQVYVSRLDGARRSCLTCGQPGPNGFPQERPQGDWILFCSWRGQPVTLGAPCPASLATTGFPATSSLSAAIVRSVEIGPGIMPSFRDLPPKKLNELADFLSSLN